MFVFRVVVLVFGLVLYLYSVNSGVKVFDYSYLLKTIIGTILFIPFVMLVLTPILFWRRDKNTLAPWEIQFQLFAYYCMTYVNFLVLFLVVRDLLWLGFGWLNLNINFYSNDLNWLVLFLPLPCLLLGYFNIHRSHFISHVNLLEENITPENSLRILQISDLHISSSLVKNFVAKTIAKSKELAPDIIVLTGDILDGPIEQIEHEFAELSRLKNIAPVLFCTGNHEYFWQIEKIKTAVQEMGFQLLINQHFHFEKNNRAFNFYGIPDPISTYFSSESVEWPKAIEADYRILLSHQPALAIQALYHNFDLQLSGHTHRGQFPPWNWLIGVFQKYGGGLYSLKRKDGGVMKLYVHQGTGYWGPKLRIGTRCEIALIVV